MKLINFTNSFILRKWTVNQTSVMLRVTSQVIRLSTGISIVDYT